ncbi:TonB-dependent receptor [Rhodoblastus acidophilus]|uniref:TonB-dependent receptor n=1 Tax=Candidatus Rhodoblastus alkanivorans TaxID=2954117 RepID=A0ABS9Z387_9HYPH|nr:TonB-dependent receptor [Candidatus Rhodoblastus alkanivorans]MCI4677342.1 TonB-dependent receptor [Candidatus Rhodoblastus alkanivorans]MCI4682077.1 TonB-dependent receptor [Candidatus Rhodoblastus alkanivorans]MDI4639379.1 TonB-dependent receptor [Rhodoblastus acidophilus]
MNRLRSALLATVAVLGAPALAFAQSGQPLPDIDVTTDVPSARPRVAARPAPAPRVAATPVVTRQAAPGVAAPPVAAPPPSAAPFDFTRDVTPANNTRINAKEISRVGSPDAAAVLQQLAPGVDVQSASGNSLSPDVVFRGFVSSPIQGTPQGLAIYQNGVRVNEAFGDTMNWDALPTFAIASMDMISANPVYGLNALGGAVNIRMKDGFNNQGGQLQISGGSYGRIQGAVEYGKQVGDFAFYGALEGVQDNGFRIDGASAIKRFYGDLGYRANGNEFHLTLGLADNEFGASGPAPIQMLQQYWGSTYTYPQTQHYQIGQIALSGSFNLSPTWSLTTNAYVRRYIQHTVDGNATSVQPCADPSQLCFGDDSTPANGVNGQQLANPFPPNTVLGEIDYSHILTTSAGANAQLTNSDTLFGLKNHATLGASFDFGATNYAATPELATILPNYYVLGSGVIIGNSGEPVTEGPVSVNSYNRYFGLYALDALDLTDKLTLSAGARLNIASISLSDQLGGDVNGDSQYTHVNPMVGLTYKITPDLLAYGSFSEANRAPTPLELGCANPQQPCLMASFLVSDPPLQQVVAQTFEAGLRGQHVLADDWGAVGWKAGVYRTLSLNDILNIPDPYLQGYGYFANVGDTLRQGVEAQINYRKGPFTVRATYAYIDATFRNYLTLGSNSPSADASGNIYVVPGDQIPLIPRQRAKISLDWDINSRTRVGADVLITGPMRYAGDASNQQPQIPGYATVSLNGAYKITRDVEVFARAENLLNQRYYTYGTYFDTSSLFQAFTNPEMLVPSQPLSFYAGLRVKF